MKDHPDRETVVLTARIPADLKERLDERAEEEDRTVSALVRLALSAYLRKRRAA
jgi:predicted transcriptional regulator